MIGKKVIWSVYGQKYTGIIKRVVQEDTTIGYKKGDLIVSPDKYQYQGQTVIVLPERATIIE